MSGLRELFRNSGASQAAIARALNVSGATVSLVVAHRKYPKTMDRAAIDAAIRQELASRGVSDADIDAALAAEVAEAGGGRPMPEPDEENAMLIRRQILSPVAKKHFGLFRNPFADEAVASSDDVYLAPDIRYVRESMWSVAKHGGFLAVVGESGSGKSTLRRDLVDRAAKDGEILVIEPYVLGMAESEKQGQTLRASHIYEAIMAVVAPTERHRRSPEARFRQLHNALKESRRSGKRHVLVIEEAHDLPVSTLKHLKRFLELEDGFTRLLSIILVGQPELSRRLSESNPEVREVVQRCEVATLLPLEDKLKDYLTFKFGRSGMDDLSRVIDPSGLAALQDRLTQSRANRGRPNEEVVSLLYPLAVQNLLTGAMNLAADYGAEVVNADVVMGV